MISQLMLDFCMKPVNRPSKVTTVSKVSGQSPRKDKYVKTVYSCREANNYCATHSGHYFHVVSWDTFDIYMKEVRR